MPNTNGIDHRNSNAHCDFALSTEPPLQAFVARHPWSRPAVRSHWMAGLSLNTIAPLIDELPDELREALGEALDAAQLCPDAAACPPSAPAEPEAWAGDLINGYIERRYDPDTQANCFLDRPLA